MSYDDDGDGIPDDPEEDYGEGHIPADIEADIEERINQADDDRLHDLHTDSGPRSGGCLLILALPALALWCLR